MSSFNEREFKTALSIYDKIASKSFDKIIAKEYSWSECSFLFDVINKAKKILVDKFKLTDSKNYNMTDIAAYHYSPIQYTPEQLGNYNLFIKLMSVESIKITKHIKDCATFIANSEIQFSRDNSILQIILNNIHSNDVSNEIKLDFIHHYELFVLVYNNAICLFKNYYDHMQIFNIKMRINRRSATKLLYKYKK